MSAAVLDCRCHVRKLRQSAPPEPADAPGRCMAFDSVVARAISELGVQLADPEVRVRFHAAEAILRLTMAELRHSRDVFVLSSPTRPDPASDISPPADDVSQVAQVQQSPGSARSGLTSAEL